MICYDYWSCLAVRFDGWLQLWYERELWLIATIVVGVLYLWVALVKGEAAIGEPAGASAKFLHWTCYALLVAVLLLAPSLVVRLSPQWLYAIITSGSVTEVQRFPMAVFTEAVASARWAMYAGLFAIILSVFATMVNPYAFRLIFLRAPIGIPRGLGAELAQAFSSPEPYTPRYVKDKSELTPIEARAAGVGVQLVGRERMEITPPPRVEGMEPDEITPPPHMPLPLPFVAWLELLHPPPEPGQPRAWQLVGDAILGHNPTQCNLVLPRTHSLSRRHASIQIRDRACFLVDHSRHGNTRVSGQRIGEEARLTHDTRFELDEVKLRFGQLGPPILEVVAGDLKGQRISGQAPPPPIDIGPPGSQLPIPNTDARVEIGFDPSDGSSSYHIRNPGREPVKLEGRPIGPTPEPLRDGNIIEIGNNVIEFHVGRLEV